jgi:phage shock protein C
MSEVKRLYRSREDRMIAGVCAGLAEYLGIDPTVVRLLFALTFFFAGGGLLVYIVMALIVPEEPLGESGMKASPAATRMPAEEKAAPKKKAATKSAAKPKSTPKS